MTLFFNILFSPNKQNVVGALLYVFLFIFIFVEHHYYRKKKSNLYLGNSEFEFVLRMNLVGCHFCYLLFGLNFILYQMRKILLEEKDAFNSKFIVNDF